MRVGIDASNLRGGGGITHLVAILEHAAPGDFGIEKIVVWAGRRTLERLPERAWLECIHEPSLDGSLASRLYWQRHSFQRRLVRKCDLLFVPGGLCTTSFHPVVTMSRNLLPFEIRETLRYGPSWMFGRNVLLRFAQASSFRRADGVIFLTEYARRTVIRFTGDLRGTTSIIPHGVDRRFLHEPRRSQARGNGSGKPFRLLYISSVDVHKHQWNVVEAVARLVRDGLRIHLELIGPAYRPALRRLDRALRRFDPHGESIRYLGEIDHGRLHKHYMQADAFVFSSSCENMPNILLEAMASGLPIACSNYGPMPEVLGDSGSYFDPLDPDSIARAIRVLAEDWELRQRCAAGAFARAREFSWDRCANETFGFLRSVARAA